jgi:hypothetical protein
VKTRTLLLLAVGCGLVILVAGSIKLFLVADDTAPQHLSIGASGTVGDMIVTVVDVHRTTEQLLVDVALTGATDDDGATSFVYGTGSKQYSPVPPPHGEGTACSSTVADATTRCVLAFDTDEPQGVLRYDRAGETLRWDITSGG